MNQRAGLVVRADGQTHGAVRIHMIRAGLRVVFHNENCRVFPIRARRNRFDEPSNGIIVVRHHELWRRKSLLDSRSVIVGKTKNRQRGYGIRLACFALRDEFLKLSEPLAKPRVASAVDIRIILRHGSIVL